MFEPRLDILPAAQKVVWVELKKARVILDNLLAKCTPDKSRRTVFTTSCHRANLSAVAPPTMSMRRSFASRLSKDGAPDSA
jgi:hypothetical protein